MFRDRADSELVVTPGRTLNHVAKIYDLLSPLMTFGLERQFSKMAIDLLELKGNEKVLDVGCGTGRITMEVAKRLSPQGGPFIIGLDAAPEMIKVAQKKSKDLKNIYFKIGVAERLPYKTDFFDAVISTFFFHHLNFELKKMALKEIGRVLKRNGKVIIVDVDIPTNLLGRICAWSGYFVFCQKEIKENILGKLREAISDNAFRSWYPVATYLGYISIFKLVK